MRNVMTRRRIVRTAAVSDGNIPSLGGTFGYDPALNRTASAQTVDAALANGYCAAGLLAVLHAR